MNNTIREYAKKKILEGLKNCTGDQRHLFKRMYSPKDISLPMEMVVNSIPGDKLEWALSQVEKTLNKDANE